MRPIRMHLYTLYTQQENSGSSRSNTALEATVVAPTAD